MAFAVRETIAASPIGTAIEAVQSRIQEEVSGRFERAGWTGEEALAGGVGAMAVTGLAVGGAKMLVNGVRGVMAKLRGGRNEHFTSVDARRDPARQCGVGTDLLGLDCPRHMRAGVRESPHRRAWPARPARPRSHRHEASR